MEGGNARDGALLKSVGMVPWLLPSRWQGWGVLWGVLSTEDRFSWLRFYRSYLTLLYRQPAPTMVLLRV